MINIRPINNVWLDLRSTQPGKWDTYSWIEKFETTLNQLAKNLDLTTTIGYCDAAYATDDLINYTENSPIPYLFKVSPNRYYIDNYSPALWKYSDIDSTIRNNYVNPNKYKAGELEYVFEHNYVLFALQANNFRSGAISQQLLLKIIHWAETSKTYVLFKLHPFTGENNRVIEFWNRLVELQVIKQYAVLVDSTYNTDSLIDGSRAVWTYSSGVALQGILKSKPVAVFNGSMDYAGAARVVTSPEEANLITAKSDDEVNRFLTWYYNKLVIDVSSDTFVQALQTRIESCIINDYDIERIFR